MIVKDRLFLLSLSVIIGGYVCILLNKIDGHTVMPVMSLVAGHYSGKSL